jgi:hypothetical protein
MGQLIRGRDGTVLFETDDPEKMLKASDREAKKAEPEDNLYIAGFDSTDFPTPEEPESNRG